MSLYTTPILPLYMYTSLINEGKMLFLRNAYYLMYEIYPSSLSRFQLILVPFTFHDHSPLSSSHNPRLTLSVLSLSLLFCREFSALQQFWWATNPMCPCPKIFPCNHSQTTSYRPHHYHHHHPHITPTNTNKAKQDWKALVLNSTTVP